MSTTVELPANAATRGAITLLMRRKKRQLVTRMILGCTIGVVGATAVVVTQYSLTHFLVLVLLGAVALVIAMAATLTWLTLRPFNEDLRASSYLQTTGPIRVARGSGPKDAVIVSVADRSFIVSRGIGARIPNLASATTDHSEHAHIIFEVRDDVGQVVFRHPAYQPELSGEIAFSPGGSTP